MERQAESLRSQYLEILRFVRRRTSSLADAEDVTQEAFATAAETLARTAQTAPPTLSLLYTVARRRLIDEARRRRTGTVSLELVADSATREDRYDGLVVHALDAALARLPAGQRDVVIMRLLEGRSFAEIGAELGVTEQASRVRFLRGLELLRDEFEKEGLTP